MIRINANERRELIRRGVPVGENGILSTHSHSSSWYLSETARNVALLKEIRTPAQALGAANE